MPEKHYFYSNGKLMLTGEYLVMNGAKALALPVRFGQSIELTGGTNNQVLEWETTMFDRPWFNASFQLDRLEAIKSNDAPSAEMISTLLQRARVQNKDFLKAPNGYQIKTHLNFDINWGLGSSSSLISNIAYLADADPYLLHKTVSSGSGYDIACARSNHPILYQLSGNKQIIEQTSFSPSFKDHLYFVYLGVKQSSAYSLKKYRRNINAHEYDTRMISELSEQMLETKYLNNFKMIIAQHELIISRMLQRPTIKQLLFSDFEGEVKSLGAWGGDFAMAISDLPADKVIQYFKAKGLDTIFSFDEIIL